MHDAPVIDVHRSIRKALKIFDADRLRWLDEAAATGPVVGLRMGPVKTWVVTDPDVARTMLVSESAAWRRPPATIAPIRLGVGENLFTQSDKSWAELQPLVAPALRKKSLEARLADIPTLIADEVRSLPFDQSIDLELTTGRIALTLAAWVLLGERLDPATAESIAHHQREVVRWVGVRLGELTGFAPVALGPRAREMKRHRDALDAYADEVIARAGTRRTDDDVLAALIRARPGGRALAPEARRGHVLGLFLAGNETTGAALAWALVHGANAPAEWARLRGGDPRYVSAYLTETLRLTPPVWGIPRTPARAGVSIRAGGVNTPLRRGHLATIYLRGMNRDPDAWSDPLRFDPSRHGAAGDEAPRVLLPFGLGSRGCIGQHLALAELAAALPALARHGDIAIEGRATEDPGFAVRVEGGLRGRFLRTSSS
jgi:cytochrome P450